MIKHFALKIKLTILALSNMNIFVKIPILIYRLIKTEIFNTEEIANPVPSSSVALNFNFIFELQSYRCPYICHPRNFTLSWKTNLNEILFKENI